MLWLDMDVGTYTHKSECNHLPKEKDRVWFFLVKHSFCMKASLHLGGGGVCVGVLSHMMIFLEQQDRERCPTVLSSLYRLFIYWP